MVLNTKQETVKVGVLTLIANLLGKSISIPTSIIIASILGPKDYGLLAVVNIIIQYMSYLNLGVLMNLSREVPMAYGKNDLDEVTLLKNIVFTNYTITTVFSIFLLWILVHLGFDYKESLNYSLVFIITFLVFLSNLDSFFHNYVKGEGKFIIFGQYELIIKIGLPISNVLLVYFFGIYGMFYSMMIGHIIGFLFIYTQLNTPKLKFKFNWHKSKILFRTGFVMYLNKIIDGILISVGVLISSKFLTQSDVGVLSYAMVIASATKVPFADILSITVNRQMAVDSGKYGEDDFSIYTKYFGKPLILFLLLTTTILGIIVLIYTYSINAFLPKFSASIPLFRILFFAVVFYNSRYFLFGYLNATRQMNKRTFITIISIFVTLASALLFVYLNLGIYGVALGVSIGFIVISINTVIVTFTQVFQKRSIALLFLTKLLVISMLLTFLLFLSGEITVFSNNDFFNYFGKVGILTIDFMIKILIFMILSFLLFSILFKEYGIVNEFKKIWNYSKSILN